MTLASHFASLHQPGRPLVLVNAWDAGSARAVMEGGAPAVGTGSMSVALAHGFEDGEHLPFDLVLANARRIVDAVDVPVTIDVERGYGVDAAQVRESLAALASTGAVGCNIEDSTSEGLRPVDEAVERVSAARAGAGPEFFVNARTDVFFVHPPEQHARVADLALERCGAFADAGASGVFTPGLDDPGLIARICEASPLPVNVFAPSLTAPNVPVLAAAGVARISMGPSPYLQTMSHLTQETHSLLA